MRRFVGSEESANIPAVSWICVKDCRDSSGNLVKAGSGSTYTVVYDAELVANNPGCFRPATRKQSRATRESVAADVPGLTLTRIAVADPSDLTHAKRQAPLKVDQAITPSHLAAGCKFNSVHTLAHLHRLEQSDVQGNPLAVKFHATHATRHAEETDKHLDKWIEDAAAKDKTFGAEYTKVTAAAAAPLADQTKSKREAIVSTVIKPALRMHFRGEPEARLKQCIRDDAGMETHGFDFCRERPLTYQTIDVDHLIGPGPRARLAPTRSLFDLEWTDQWIASLRADGLYPLGPWHTHVTHASTQDPGDERIGVPSSADIRGWLDWRQVLDVPVLMPLIVNVNSRGQILSAVPWFLRERRPGVDTVEPGVLI